MAASTSAISLTDASYGRGRGRAVGRAAQGNGSGADNPVGMDDAFAFVAPVMPRRKVDPFAMKVAAVSMIFVALVGAFGAFVVGHERAADARAEATVQAGSTAPVTVEDRAALDVQARDALQAAVGFATDAYARTSSYAGAGVPQLTIAAPELLFVDGPSEGPGIVSVVATDAAWAAAVMSDSGCRWIALSAGVMRQGSDAACVAGEILTDLGA